MASGPAVLENGAGGPVANHEDLRGKSPKALEPVNWARGGLRLSAIADNPRVRDWSVIPAPGPDCAKYATAGRLGRDSPTVDI